MSGITQAFGELISTVSVVGEKENRVALPPSPTLSMSALFYPGRMEAEEAAAGPFSL